MIKFHKILFLLSILPISAVNAACQTGSGQLPQIVNVEEPKKHQYRAEDMPPPFQTNSAFRASKIVPQPITAALTIPKGFKINVLPKADLISRGGWHWHRMGTFFSQMPGPIRFKR
jgi:hypothetical protein